MCACWCPPSGHTAELFITQAGNDSEESSRGESATETLVLSHCLATESRQVRIKQQNTGKDLSIDPDVKTDHSILQRAVRRWDSWFFIFFFNASSPQNMLSVTHAGFSECLNHLLQTANTRTPVFSSNTGTAFPQGEAQLQMGGGCPLGQTVQRCDIPHPAAPDI